MRHGSAPFPFTCVVVVADLESPDADNRALECRHDLELTGPDTLASVLRAISSLGFEAHHVLGPADLAGWAERHSDAVVLTIYGGQRSRNRMALVPAVCETFGLRFIGPDAYGRICAQDKEVSKRLALDCGLRTPPWRVVRSAHDLSLLDPMPLPVVVKPLLEGTSIGIGRRNLQHEWPGAKALAVELLDVHQQPVMIESFVPGREVSYNSIQTPGGPASAFCEVVVNEDPAYFVSRLFDVEEKFLRKAQRRTVNIDGEISAEDEIKIQRLLSIFGNYGYCRVDGRFQDGRFHFIELTPDAWIDPTGQFAEAYTLKGWTYEEVIAAILSSVAPNPPSP